MIYIHIPFCKRKCYYCNFYSGGNPNWNKYLKAVVREFSLRIKELKGDSLSSLYIGGGTPSLIPAGIFKNFSEELWAVINESDIKIDNDIEITIEANPDDITSELIKTWKEAGINRVSMGVQSLNDEELRAIGRRHSAHQVKVALATLKDSFQNISVDLIYGLPKQTSSSLAQTIEQLIAFDPQHISTYALTVEEHTPLYVLNQKGKLPLIGEEEMLGLGELTDNLLKSNGYERYEISNYSKPGFRSRHNSGYWSRKEYLGLGPSAASYDGNNTRRTNPADIKGYVSHFENKAATMNPFYEEEILDDTQLLIEDIFVSIRTKEGINLDYISSRFGSASKENLCSKAQKWINQGMLYIENNNLKLTSRGIPISDHIILGLI